MRRLRTFFLIAYLLAFLFMIAPVLSALLASFIASAAGAKLDESGRHPCVIFGFDFGGVLYAMFVAGWLGLLTFPIGLLVILQIAATHLKARQLPSTTSPAAPPVSELPRGFATITPVPEPHHQNIRNQSYDVKLNLISLIPVAFIFGGMGLCTLGWFFIPRNQLAVIRLLVVFGGSAAAWGVYTARYCMGVYENRWAERRLRAEIRSRPDALVEADDPDAMYASLIPRENWSQVKLTMSSDLLLMRIDPGRKEVLLEGDSDRYRIPAVAISACQPQRFFHPADTGRRSELSMVMLMIQAPDGMRELLLWVAQKGWWPRTNTSRRKVAEEMCEKINSL